MPETDLFDLEVAGRLALAALTGLAIGLEREWSGHASGPGARFAGVRTFLLLGLIGGMAGLLAAEGWRALAVALVAGAALLAAGAYVVAAWQTGDRDGTTETAALLVLATGGLCGLGYRGVGSGVAAVAVLALAEKSRIRGLVARIGAQELLAAFRFAVLALVVLPLLPVGPFGPYDAIRPRELWAIVLLFSGINFLGYLARRAAGPEWGYGIAGLLGGLVSSTAVALTFARASRSLPVFAASLALGVVAACTTLVPRVLVVALVMSPPVAARLFPYLLPAAVAGAVVILWVVVRRAPIPAPGAAEVAEDNPLRLGSAIQMVLAFQVVLFVVPAADRLWGSAGVLGSAALLGLTDMDALTYSMARLGAAGDPALAARAIAVGLLSNTVLKLGLVLVLGSPRFRRVAGAGLAALGLVVLLSLLILP
jgi:uncharacterized membrane protein (DUF4010 family)